MKYEIYQMKPEHVGLRFMRYRSIETSGIKVTIDFYTKVYEGEVEDVTEERKKNLLERLYREFNINRPQDFTGHSMSVSDVVVLDEFDPYYCDSIGFTPLYEFFDASEDDHEQE